MLPEALELPGPFVERLDGLGIGAVELLAAVAADADEADVAENAEMFGHGGLFEAEAGDDSTDGLLVESEEEEDLAAARFGDSVESVGGGRGARHGGRIHAHMGICQGEFLGLPGLLIRKQKAGPRCWARVERSEEGPKS